MARQLGRPTNAQSRRRQNRQRRHKGHVADIAADPDLNSTDWHRLTTMKCFDAEELVKINGKLVTAMASPEFVEALHAKEEFPEPPKHWRATAAKATA